MSDQEAVVAEPQAQEVKPEKKVQNGGVRGSTKFSMDAKITIISEQNPKRPGSKAASDWLLYQNGMSVKEARDAGISMADILYNTSHRFISVEGYDAPEPKKQVRKPKAEKPVVAEAEPVAA